MNNEADTTVSLEDHRKAFTEVAFLLDIFASTVDNIMGGATASVGRIAGREMARKLPIYLEHPSLEEVLKILSEQMISGFGIKFQPIDDGANISFDRCAIRQVCVERKIEPGCELCRLFHFYFDGIINELISRPVKSKITSSGDACTVCTSIQ